MNGKLKKTNNGWVMRHGQPVQLKVGNTPYTHNNYNEELPLHPNDAKTYDWLYQAYTPEEFERTSDDTLYRFRIVNEFNPNTKEFVNYAQIVTEVGDEPVKEETKQMVDEWEEFFFYMEEIGEELSIKAKNALRNSYKVPQKK